MSNRRRYTIAVLIGQNKSAYLNDLICGLQMNAVEENVNLVFVSEAKVPKYCGEILTEEFGALNDYHFHSIHEYLRYIKPDAIILAYGSMTGFRYVRSKEEYYQMFGGIPCIMIEDMPGDEKVPYLISDNYGGMRAIVEHLVEHHGYKKIVFMAGPELNYDSNERLSAYRDVMAENGIEIKDSMIEHGDYSSEVKEQINALIDNNPGLEAIVCANDNMAQCAYIECERRGLYPGDKIAITGYDDSDTCKKLSPALTSVSHSGTIYAYNAIKEAINLCEGKEVKSKKIAANIAVRGSCGCDTIKSFNPGEEVQVDTARKYTVSRLRDITNEVYKNIPYKKKEIQLYYLLQELVDYILFTIFEPDNVQVSTDALSRYLRKVYKYPYISGNTVLENIISLLSELSNGLQKHGESNKLLGVITYIREYMAAATVKIERIKTEQAEKQAWFLSSFTRDLIAADLPYERNVRCLFQRMKDMGISSSYLYFFQDEYIYDQGKGLPDDIYLSGFYNEDAMETVKYGKGKKVREGSFFTDVMPKDRARCYYAYVLFAGNRHYGVMMCENTQEQYDFVLACSLQLGSMFHFMTLQGERNDAQKALRDSMKQLKAQNKVLNFVSKQDELTGLLNRRGMMEEIMAEMSANQGERAVLFFADLDHLKEINDCFGHSAGDSAIDMAAEFLRLNAPKGSVISRIGGDEFVVFTTDIEPDKVKEKIQKSMNYYNNHSGEPYYVEMSIGYSEFVCYDSVDIEEEISKSDKLLYEEKKHRRKSVKKEVKE
ncbi:MAG: GGDEF domain-containing protein [Lachnospiraceae bacterium]|nr:GGDEF domain-containing protein [Lachnospiraceae bacterium]